MAYLIIWIENLKQTWRRTRQQRRLALIQGELETAQADCAALGAYIGRIIQRKTELEPRFSAPSFEAVRETTLAARGANNAGLGNEAGLSQVCIEPFRRIPRPERFRRRLTGNHF